MQTATQDNEEELGAALSDLLRHPLKMLVQTWSWQAAGWSALLRTTAFFATNWQAGRPAAVRAALVEAAFALPAAGLLGAVSQRLRLAKPVWATAVVVWLAMPMAMLLAQLGVHKLAGTPHLGMGLALSFLFAAIASSFSWYAMRRGALLGGQSSTTMGHDSRHLPGIILDYVLAVPRALLRGKAEVEDRQ